MHFDSRGKAYAFSSEQRIFLIELEKKSQITLLKWNAAVVNLQIGKGCQQCQCSKGTPTNQLQSEKSSGRTHWYEITGRRHKDQNRLFARLLPRTQVLFHNPCSFLVPFHSLSPSPNKLKVHRGHTPWLLHVTWHATQLHRFQDMFSEIPLIFRISFVLGCLGIRQCKTSKNNPKQTTAQYPGTPVLWKEKIWASAPSNTAKNSLSNC